MAFLGAGLTGTHLERVDSGSWTLVPGGPPAAGRRRDTGGRRRGEVRQPFRRLTLISDDRHGSETTVPAFGSRGTGGRWQSSTLARSSAGHARPNICATGRPCRPAGPSVPLGSLSKVHPSVTSVDCGNISVTLGSQVQSPRATSADLLKHFGHPGITKHSPTRDRSSPLSCRRVRPPPRPPPPVRMGASTLAPLFLVRAPGSVGPCRVSRRSSSSARRNVPVLGLV